MPPETIPETQSTDAYDQHEIHMRQNTPEMITLLQAKSGAYDAAQELYRLQFVVLMVVPLAIAVVKLAVPPMSQYALALSVLLLLIDAGLLEPMQKERKKLGALFQERFDCTLFQLPWRTHRVGLEPTPEQERKWAALHPARANLAGWYPAVVQRLPRLAAIAVCQRASGSWNGEMRERYARSLWMVALSLMMLLVVAGISRGATVLAVLSWGGIALPVFTWLVREATRQKDAAAASQKVAERARKVWLRVMGGASTEEVSADLRELQNDLFDQRRRDPQVFSWVYSRFRSVDEETMRAAATRMVEEYVAVNAPR